MSAIKSQYPTTIDIIDIIELLQQSGNLPELEYVVPPTIPQVLSITFQEQLYQVPIINNIFSPAYLLDFAINCSGSTGCKKIVVKLLEATNTRVKVSIEDVYKAGFFRYNPGGIFPYVSWYDDFAKVYQAQIAPLQKIGLVNPSISLDIPSASVAGVSVGEQATIEVVYALQKINRVAKYY